MTLRLELDPHVLDRLERLRGAVPVVTKRTALVQALVRIGLTAAEKNPACLVAAQPNQKKVPQ